MPQQSQQQSPSSAHGTPPSASPRRNNGSSPSRQSMGGGGNNINNMNNSSNSATPHSTASTMQRAYEEAWYKRLLSRPKETARYNKYLMPVLDEWGAGSSGAGGVGVAGRAAAASVSNNVSPALTPRGRSSASPQRYQQQQGANNATNSSNINNNTNNGNVIAAVDHRFQSPSARIVVHKNTSGGGGGFPPAQSSPSTAHHATAPLTVGASGAAAAAAAAKANTSSSSGTTTATVQATSSRREQEVKIREYVKKVHQKEQQQQQQQGSINMASEQQQSQSVRVSEGGGRPPPLSMGGGGAHPPMSAVSPAADGTLVPIDHHNNNNTNQHSNHNVVAVPLAHVSRTAFSPASFRAYQKPAKIGVGSSSTQSPSTASHHHHHHHRSGGGNSFAIEMTPLHDDATGTAGEKQSLLAGGGAGGDSLRPFSLSPASSFSRQPSASLYGSTSALKKPKEDGGGKNTAAYRRVLSFQVLDGLSTDNNAAAPVTTASAAPAAVSAVTAATEEAMLHAFPASPTVMRGPMMFAAAAQLNTLSEQQQMGGGAGSSPTATSTSPSKFGGGDGRRPFVSNTSVVSLDGSFRFNTNNSGNALGIGGGGRGASSRRQRAGAQYSALLTEEERRDIIAAKKKEKQTEEMRRFAEKVANNASFSSKGAIFAAGGAHGSTVIALPSVKKSQLAAIVGPAGAVRHKGTDFFSDDLPPPRLVAHSQMALAPKGSIFRSRSADELIDIIEEDDGDEDDDNDDTQKRDGDGALDPIGGGLRGPSPRRYQSVTVAMLRRKGGKLGASANGGDAAPFSAGGGSAESSQPVSRQQSEGVVVGDHHQGGNKQHHIYLQPLGPHNNIHHHRTATASSSASGGAHRVAAAKAGGGEGRFATPSYASSVNKVVSPLQTAVTMADGRGGGGFAAAEEDAAPQVQQQQQLDGSVSQKKYRHYVATSGGLLVQEVVATEEDLLDDKEVSYVDGEEEEVSPTVDEEDDDEYEIISRVDAVLDLLPFAAPAVLSYFLAVLVYVIPLSYVGRLHGPGAFNAASVGFFFISVVIWYPVQGMLFALDTLCSHEYGRDATSDGMGLVLQRGLIIAWGVLAALLCVLYPMFGPLLSFFYDAKTAAQATEFLMFCPLFLFAIISYTAFMKFVANQMLPALATIATMVAVACTPAIQSHFAPMGLRYAMLGMGIAALIQCGALVAMALLHKRTRCTFGSIRIREALDPQDVWLFLKIAGPSAVFVAAEAGALDASILITGTLGDGVGSAWSALMNTEFLLVSVANGLSVAACAKVGSALGGNQPVNARTYALTAIGVVVGWGLLVNLPIVLAFFEEIMAWYGADLKEADKVKYLFVLAQLFEATEFACQGIFSGANLNHVGAPLLVFSMWGVGVTTSSLLGLGLLNKVVLWAVRLTSSGASSSSSSGGGGAAAGDISGGGGGSDIEGSGPSPAAFFMSLVSTGLERFSAYVLTPLEGIRGVSIGTTLGLLVLCPLLLRVLLSMDWESLALQSQIEAGEDDDDDDEEDEEDEEEEEE